MLLAHHLEWSNRYGEREAGGTIQTETYRKPADYLAFFRIPTVHSTFRTAQAIEMKAIRPRPT